MKHMEKRSFVRLLACTVIASLLWAACLPLSVLATGSENGTNIAKGKRAIACHQESASLTEEKALDGNTSTRFAAGGGCRDQTWYVLDLEDTYDLSCVRINWEAAHPSRYVLEISDDGQTFTELATVDAPDAGWKETTLSGTGRFLRIRELQRALSTYGFSIWELEVYGERNTLRPNTDPYDRVTVQEVTGGTVQLSASGFVRRGTDVTVTAVPSGDNTTESITVGNEPVAVTNNQATFTVSGDTAVGATFATKPMARYECEEAMVYAADMTTRISGLNNPDANASGGYVAGGTGGKYYLFPNVQEANCVHIAYASMNTSRITLWVRYPGEEVFHETGSINFSTTNSWYMDYSYIASSPLVYIPEGSDIMISPAVDCNLDYLFLTCEAMTTQPDANTVTASDLSAQAMEDIRAPFGCSLAMTAGDSVTFTVPEGQTVYNVFSLTSCTEVSGAYTLLRGQEVLGSGTLSPTGSYTYTGTGLRTAEYRPGDILTLRITAGDLLLSHVTVNAAAQPETLTVEANPAVGERLTVCLDGTWAVAAQPFGSWSVPETVPDIHFINSICVPGLWHSAAFDLGSYAGCMTWLEKTVVLREEPDGQVLLRIDAAQFGRYIYVNGVLAGSYAYNYSQSVTDISGLLHKGENRITVMLGDWAQQYNDKTTVAHVLYDGESTTNKPGITDSVYLIFNREPEVSAVQYVPDLSAGTVTFQVTLANRSAAAVTSDVTVTVYELGICTDGVADRSPCQVAAYCLRGATVSADGTVVLTTDPITLSGFGKDKYWSPDSPFLYMAEIRTSGDTYTTRFGMRTFGFDDRGNALLNGEICYLMGTNVAIQRFFDDPLCGNNPWDAAWIRKLYSEYKECGWFCFRTHLGGANSKWFDLADEMGFLIFDEYPNWGDSDGCTAQTIMPEIYAWIDARGNHPSLICFDIMNEGGGTLTSDIIPLGRSYDIQQRPWDNGWRPPVGENDSIECHPYIMGGQGISGLQTHDNTKPLVTTADIGWTAEQYAGHAFILNEHGELWIDRNGQAMSGTAGFWNQILPNATNEERLTYYAEAMAAEIECFRAGRAYAGMLFFCGLTSSPAGAVGITCDILSPDVSTPESLQIRPYTKELLTNAFRPLGICLDEYTEDVRRGQALTLPVVLINDTGEAVEDLTVTLVIRSGDTVVYADRQTVSVPVHTGNKDGLATAVFDLTVPGFKDYCDNGRTLTVTASYTLDGETVYSLRKWTVQGGKTTDGELPVYDWLDNGQTPDTETETETETETDGGTVTEPDTGHEETVESNRPTDTDPGAEAPSDTTGTTAGGCASVANIGGLTALAVGLSAGLLSARRRRQRKGERTQEQ